MKQAFVQSPGANGTFVTADAPEPVAGAGEVVVTVEAAGLAFADVLMCAGAYPGTPKGGFTPGYDMVGRVSAVPDGTDRWRVGDRVAGLLVRGGLAEKVAVDGRRLVAVPESVGAAEAACLPLNYVTAHQMLHRVAAVRRDATLLVFGAGGGVGTALCELGVRHGCRVVGVAGRSKHDRLAALGVVPVESRTPELAEAVRAAAGGHGVDAAFDPVGGQQLALGWAALREGGHLVSFGFAGAVFGQGSPAGVFLTSQLRMLWWRLTDRRRRVSFYAVASRRDRHPADYAEDLGALFRLLEAGEISPSIDSTLSLDDVPAAYERLRHGNVGGKLIFTATPRP